MKRLAGYPHWFFAALMTAITGLLCTGIALLPSMLEMRLDIEPPVHIDGGARLLAAAAHCAAGFILVAMVGGLLSIHVRIGWRHRLNRSSGVALLALIMVLMVSALGIYYLGDDIWSRASSLTHTGAGLLTMVVITWHAIKGQRLRRDSSIWKHSDSVSNVR